VRTAISSAENLDASEILRTGERLERRIRERFPDASLGKLAARLAEITRESITAFSELMQAAEATLGILFFLGTGVFFFVKLEGEAELRRYLDYSCELLALVGKVAALYAEGFADPVILDAADDLEDLTAGLIGKIWQKLMMMMMERAG